MKKIVIDFEEFNALCREILEEVSRGGRTYRSVLCPLKGGFYLSHFMSRRLGIPMEYIVISSYVRMDQKEFSVHDVPELSGGRYLLCDDVYDSGRTVEKIRSLYPHVTFDVACLLAKSDGAAGYFGRRIPSDVWVEFFWETM